MATKMPVSKPATKTSRPATSSAAAPKTSKEKKPDRVTDPEIPPEHIQEAAYYRWLERGCPHGDEHADWFEAQKALADKKRKRNS